MVCWGVGKIYSSGKRDTIRPPYPLCFLKKTRKNDLEPEIQVNYSFVNLSILISFFGEQLSFRKKMHHPKPCSLQIHPRLFSDNIVDTFFSDFFRKTRTKTGCHVLYALWDNTAFCSSISIFSFFFVFFAPNVPFIAYMPYRRLLLVFRDWV